MTCHPPGTYQYLRDIGAFKPTVWCDRCGMMVGPWHQHHGKPGQGEPGEQKSEIGVER